MKLLGVVVVGGLVACQVTTRGRGTTVPPSSSSSSASSSSSPDAERVSGEGSDPAITMPDVTGLSRADAEARLRAAGVRGEIALFGADDGRVCGTIPGAGRETRVALSVTLSFCGGHKGDRQVDEGPQLGGLTEEAATRRARDSGFTGRIDVIHGFHEGCKLETVCEVDPIRWYVGGHLTLTIGRERGPND